MHITLSAQQSALSPEWEQMSRNAKEYENRGDYKNAIITYKQAIQLVPGNIVLYKELGNALYKSANYDEAEQTILPLISKKEADPACYQLLAAIQLARNETKKSKNTLQDGLTRFPSSGMLYFELGNLYYSEQKPEAALDAWLDGILKEPGYPRNYHEAGWHTWVVNMYCGDCFMGKYF